MRGRLLDEVDVAVGDTTGGGKIETTDLGVFVANPILSLRIHDDLDGPGAGLGDATTCGTCASLGHDHLLWVDDKHIECLSYV